MVDGVIDGWESYEDAVAAYPPDPIADECEGGALLYSSGTTGKPKGIVRPLSLAPMGESIDPLTAFFDWCGFVEGSVYLSPAPLYHAAPIAWSMGIQRLGGTVVLMERFDAEQALALIERYGVTCGQFVPTMFVRMLKLPKDRRDAYDVSSLRSVVHAAAPCPVDVKQQMMDWWGPIIYEYYSSTEGAGATFVEPEEWLAHPGTVGKPMVGAAHVLDDDGNELPIGEAGTLWFEGPLGFEYRNDPAKTAEAVNALGYKTRRRHRLRRRGGLPLPHRSQGAHDHQRRREHLPAGSGERARDAPEGGRRRGDRRTRRRPRRAGQGGRAAGRLVRRRPGLEAELIEYCRANIAHYKCPRTVDFERELPRLDTGKLYKGKLRARYWPAGWRSVPEPGNLD